MKYKRLKQILAITGLVIIAGLYGTTLVLSLTGNESTKNLLIASIICTVIVPVLMYVIAWIYKLVKHQAEESRKESPEILNAEKNALDQDHSDLSV